MSGTLTNTAFVSDLMEFSRHGALAQVFIIDAIQKHAERVAAALPSSIDHALISGEGWVGVAKEIKSKVDAQYGSPAAVSPVRVRLFSALLAADESFVDGYEVETIRLQKGPNLEQTYLFTAEDARLFVDDQEIELTVGSESSTAIFVDTDGFSHRLDLNEVVRRPITAQYIAWYEKQTGSADVSSRQPEG